MKREKKYLFGAVLFVVCTTIAFSLSPLTGTAIGKTYRFKIQSAFPAGDKSSDLLDVFAEAAEKRSKGQIKISVFRAPEIVPIENLFGATKKGVIHMMQSAGVVHGEIIPAAYVEFGLPGAFQVPHIESFEGKAEEIRKVFMEHGLADILREEYAKQGLYFLDVHVYGPVPITVSKVNPKKCSDLEGLIVRSDGLNMKYQTAVGMKSISVPGEEAYLSLKTGVLDAAEWDISCITGLKWHEVAPYWLRGMEADEALGEIAINMKVWNSLPDDLKQALRDAGKDYFDATVAGYKGELDIAYQLIKEGKLFSVELDQECKAKYAAMAKKLMDEVAESDPASAKAVKIIKKWRGWE
jgi:TRAP-type C4-dicarboxylate transport system substrate-binding protein